MNLRGLARLIKAQRRREAAAGRDPAELPPHLAEQQRRIDAGLGYPVPPDWPGSPGRRTW